MKDSEAAPRRSETIGLVRIFAAFLRLGCTSFGGGMAAWLHREMVLRRRWIGDRNFLTMLAISQVMPGSTGIKMTVLIGQHLRGAAGAAVALVGLLAGPFAVVLAIGTIYVEVGEAPIVQAVLGGVAAAVIGLTFAAGLSGLAREASSAAAWGIAAATVLSIGVLRWPMLPVIAALAPLSIGLALFKTRRF